CQYIKIEFEGARGQSNLLNANEVVYAHQESEQQIAMQRIPVELDILLAFNNGGETLN
ncbi:hypothetical protein AVEN_153437-1, partial [Araneus ventricosus]